jgi:hypothetical protein
VSNLERAETKRYLEMLYVLRLRPLIEKVCCAVLRCAALCCAALCCAALCCGEGRALARVRAGCA